MAKTAQGCGQGTPAHGQGTPGCGSLTHVVVDWQVLLGELPCPTLGPRLHVLLQLVFAPPIQPALAVCEQYLCYSAPCLTSEYLWHALEP